MQNPSPPFQPGPPPPQQLIRTYKGVLAGSAEKKFQKDAAKLAQEGWRVQTMNSTAAALNPRNIISVMVVYVR